MSVLLLHGRNSVDIEDRIAAILRQDDPQGLNAVTLDLAVADISDVASALSTPGFFGARRTVIMYGIPGVDKTPQVEWSDLETALLGRAESTRAILVSFQRVPANRRSLKAAKNNQWTIDLHDLMYGNALVDWVRERAEKSGAMLDAQAARSLLDRLYPTSWQREDRWSNQTINLRMIATEVEKLAAGTSDGQITRESVLQLVADRTGVTAFKLNDETFEGRTDRALVELDNVLTDGEAPERVIGQLGYQQTVLNAARFVQRYGPDTVSDASGVSSGQLKATLSRKAAWRDEDGMTNAIAELRRAEWLVKAGRAGSADAVLTPVVANIAEGFRKSRS